MTKKTKAVEAPAFASITETARVTGLSVSFLRKAVAEKRIPFTKSGNKTVLYVPDVVQAVRESMK